MTTTTAIAAAYAPRGATRAVVHITEDGRALLRRARVFWKVAGVTPAVGEAVPTGRGAYVVHAPALARPNVAALNRAVAMLEALGWAGAWDDLASLLLAGQCFDITDVVALLCDGDNVMSLAFIKRRERLEALSDLVALVTSCDGGQ